jgi:hypothetical protein
MTDVAPGPVWRGKVTVLQDEISGHTLLLPSDDPIPNGAVMHGGLPKGSSRYRRRRP